MVLRVGGSALGRAFRFFGGGGLLSRSLRRGSLLGCRGFSRLGSLRLRLSLRRWSLSQPPPRRLSNRSLSNRSLWNLRSLWRRLNDSHVWRFSLCLGHFWRGFGRGRSFLSHSGLGSLWGLGRLIATSGSEGGGHRGGRRLFTARGLRARAWRGSA